MRNLSDEELINQAAGFSCGCDKCIARVEPPRKELFSRLERGRKAIEAMDEIRRIFDTCPSYDVNTFQDIDIILMRFENEYSGVTDEN